MSKLAIIGTAGRKDDGKALALDISRYLVRMTAAALKVAELTGATTLVSGGAAYADHIAVLLFLSDPVRFSLHLELPERLVECADGYCYDDNGTRDFKGNAGAVSNHYHKLFSKAIAKSGGTRSSFADFGALEGHPKVTIESGGGFLARNLKVAEKADHVLAMTFGQGKRLKDGGTAHTMSAFLARGVGTAYHLDLNTLKLYANATVS